jgi:hypothetical protein
VRNSLHTKALRHGLFDNKKLDMQSNPDNPYTLNDLEDEAFSFRKLIQNWWDDFVYTLRFWRILLLVAVMGTLLGLAYAWIKHTTYTARLTFVVEEAKTSGGSIASALAGQLGFDIGSSGNGVLAGDNVLELLKSRSLIKKALLTPFGDASGISIADAYADAYQWKEKWKNDKSIGRQVNFAVNQSTFSRLEDSLLQTIVKRIVDRELSITKADKKLSFFILEVSTRDEGISKLLCERLLKITTDFYVDAKTRRLSNNVARLQRRADSLGILLDRKTYSSAEASQGLLDANPAYSSPMVNAEISSRNKFIQSTIYAEVVKNLEVSRTSLIQETPTVQIIDSPELPLKKNKVLMLTGGLTGFFAGLGIAILFFAVTRQKK